MRFLNPRIILSIAVLTCSASLAFALAPSMTPPKTPTAKPAATRPATKPAATAPVIVAVKKLDGTTVRGTLVSADPDDVNVRSGGAKADPVAIPWSDIASISNGLTRAQAMTQWKAQHKDDLCPACHGDRTVACPTCHGTGHDPTQSTACDECGGSGFFYCTAKNCDDGKIPCPKPCLKLTQGQWTKHPDGSLWRKFSGRHGSFEWSEHHVGELIVTQDGNPTNIGKCPTCNGTTKVDCPTCDGLGAVACTKCDATGVQGPACGACKDGQVTCTTCAGTGLKKQG